MDILTVYIIVGAIGLITLWRASRKRNKGSSSMSREQLDKHVNEAAECLIDEETISVFLRKLQAEGTQETFKIGFEVMARARDLNLARKLASTS